MVTSALVFALVLSVLHVVTLAGTYGVFEWMFRNDVLKRFQVDRGRAPKSEMMRRCNINVIVGQLGFFILGAALLYPLWTLRGGVMNLEWDPIWVVALHLLAYSVINETIFYWSHRTLHTPWLYKHVHSRHHRFVHVRVPVAEYAHNAENAVNYVAFFAGPLLLGAPFTTLCVWIVFRIFETAEAHSGYAFTRSASRHAYHHLHAHDGAYGSFLGIWDTLLGTDKAWRESRARQANA